jgi:tRNA 5-methylaminomethyl-2-thiouridine biosynthesis bifunctional protein
MREDVHSPSLEWKGNLPISALYDDSYFSDDSGSDETRHVFLDGNGIFALSSAHFPEPRVIAETGFGTGLNFLVLWETWRQQQQTWPWQFFSVEKHPLQIEDLKRAHQAWPSLKPFAEELQAQWPSASQGWQKCSFANGLIELYIFHGDILDWCKSLAELQLHPHHWFLDGFSPSKNPEMWCDSLFKTMANSAQMDTSFATYTSAGFVRRQLLAEGFLVEKVKGFGRKRSMLKGHWPRPN